MLTNIYSGNKECPERSLMTFGQIMDYLASGMKYILNPDRRKASPFHYPNFKKMSVFEAKRYGLYLNNEPLTEARVRRFLWLLKTRPTMPYQDRTALIAHVWNFQKCGRNQVLFIDGDNRIVDQDRRESPAFANGREVVVKTRHNGIVNINSLDRYSLSDDFIFPEDAP
ncbi:hypothetical protein [Neptuniibacter sp. QD37_11]|uniref:hypothetical protein n=1 Tax=Neptuniibacter sp. QD37_11 TaxID=3398209 RepID=UPI0039F5690E